MTQEIKAGCADISMWDQRCSLVLCQRIADKVNEPPASSAEDALFEDLFETHRTLATCHFKLFRLFAQSLGLLDDGILDVWQGELPTLVVMHVSSVEGFALRSSLESKEAGPGSLVVSVEGDGRGDGQALDFENKCLKVREDLDGSSVEDDLSSRRDARDPVVEDAVMEWNYRQITVIISIIREVCLPLAVTE